MSATYAERPDPLFSGDDLREFLERRRAEMLAAIEHIPTEVILSRPAADLAAEHADEYGCIPLQLRPDETSTDELETTLSVDEIPDGRLLYDAYADDEREVPGSVITFHVPFTGEPQLFFLRGGTWISSMPRGHVRGGELVFAFRTTSPNAEQLKAGYQRLLQQTQSLIQDSTRIVSEFNSKLLTDATAAINARREKILKARNTVSALGFPMKRRPDAPKTYAVPPMRRRIVTRGPSTPAGAPFRPEPVLLDEDYEEILRIIRGMSHVLERSPRAFHQMGEEDLRSHFLVQLNGQFEGTATGETFNGKGKTDILVREDDRNIFVAECKFWRGPAAFTATIDQLLGYLSWRDTKTAILLFNRDVAMSTVLPQIPQRVREHPNFKRELPSTEETMFRAVLHQNGDVDREVVLTVLAFSVPA